MSDYIIKDSGRREEVSTGMVRDTREGKGRYDLLACRAIRRYAQHLEKGCGKYGSRNWEQGAPFCRFMDSALRHCFQWLEGMEDEDHLAAAMFNIAAIMELQERGRIDLDDRPEHPEDLQPAASLVDGYSPILHAWEKRS